MKDWKILAKARMKELGMSQLELANKLKCTQSSVNQRLNGKRSVDIDLINEIFTILDLPPIPVESVADLERVYEYPVISWESLASYSESWKTENTDNSIKTEVNAGINGYWLRVQNDSMTANSGVTFPEGMYILVNPNTTISNNSFVIAKNSITNQATFRKFIKDAEIRYLKPLNSSYQTTILDNTWQIIGEVIDARWKLK